MLWNKESIAIGSPIIKNYVELIRRLVGKLFFDRFLLQVELIRQTFDEEHAKNKFFEFGSVYFSAKYITTFKSNDSSWVRVILDCSIKSIVLSE